MAKYDPDRIADTADPYPPGTSGIEPLCDGQGVQFVKQTGGIGSPTDPSIVQGTDGNAPERLATQTTLEQVFALLQPSSVASVPKTPKTVPTAEAESIVDAETPANLVRVQADFANADDSYICIGDSSVTLENGEQLGPGDVYSEAVDDAAKLFCIGSTTGLKLRIKVL